MDKIKFTLYEITGYLLPGAICAIGVFIIFCLANSGRSYIPTSAPTIGAYLLIFYTLGHACQSIANLVTNSFENKAIQNRSTDLQNISHKLAIQKTDPIDQFRIISARPTDEIQHERIETYREREGYYRGTSIAQIITSLSLIASLFFGNIVVDTSEITLTLTITYKVIMLIGGILLTTLYALRYFRFLKYRINLAVDVNL